MAGATDTSPTLIERTMSLDPGEALSFDRLNRARDRLYDTGLFRTVTLETAPVPNADGTPNPGVLRANVTVEELPKYRLRYGFQLYDPSSPLFDPEVGHGRSRRRRGPHAAGAVRPRPHRRHRHAPEPLGADRADVHQQPHVLRPAGADQRLSSAPRTRRRPAPASSSTRARNSITFDQRVRYRRLFQVGYGYSFEKRRFDFLVQLPTLPAPIPVEVRANIGRLLGSIVLDDRDDVVNTRQGPFHSSSVELGPTALGSTLPFRKYLGQQFYFVPWKKVTFGFGGAARGRRRTRPRADHDRTPARRRRQHRSRLRGRHARRCAASARTPRARPASSCSTRKSGSR